MNKKKLICKLLFLTTAFVTDSVQAGADANIAGGSEGIKGSSGKAVIGQNAVTDYLPKGIRLNSFEIRPVMELGTDWNSNIYNRQNDVVSSVITHVKPAVSVYSNWNRHFVGLDVNSDIQNYIDHPHENRQIVNVRLNGKLDVEKDTFGYSKFFYLRAPEQRGAPDSPANALYPTGSQTIGGEMGYDYTKYRIRLHVDNTTAQLLFEDGVTGLGTLIPNAQNRNRLGNISTVRLGYEITPNYEAFVSGSYNFINYDYYNQQGFSRSSDGYKVVGGVGLELTGKLTGNVRAGYQSQTYKDTYYAPVSGFAGGLTMNWTPTGLTKVIGDITRTINETTQVGYSAFFSTAFTVAVEHELLRNVLLNFNAGYIMNDYESGIIPKSQLRSENNYMVGFNGKYLINRYFFLRSGVNYAQRQVSNVPDTNYKTTDVFFAVGSQY
jgi:hypothetical protein